MQNPQQTFEYYQSINLDITHRCLLQCSKCARQLWPGIHKRGYDISLESMKKIADTFYWLNFCGQLGDAIYHPRFHEILKLCTSNGNNIRVNTNGSGKSIEWWDKCFKINPNILWIIALGGLPKDSHNYRKNQDGKQVFKVMKHLAAKGGKITWQYIPFRYNENDIEQCKKIAKDIGVSFQLTKSSRWDINDELRPINPNLSISADRSTVSRNKIRIRKDS